MTRLAIVIVSFNTRPDLDACLASLHARPPRAPHEIVVVDNASSDGSLDMVRSRWPGVRTIAAPDNLGFARANNLGIRATQSDLILLLNSDTLVPGDARRRGPCGRSASIGTPDAIGPRESASPGPASPGPPSPGPPSPGSASPGSASRESGGTPGSMALADSMGPIDRLIAALDHDPGAAVAGPRLVDADGRPELSFGRMIGPLNEARQKLLGRLYSGRVPVAAAYVDRLLSRPGHPDWVSGACLLVRRADAEAVGLLDERFFMYTEDVDFCAAIRARGRRILFVPEAEIVHLRGRARRIASAATQAAYRRSQIAFYDKHHPAWARWLRRYLRLRGR